MTTHPFWPGQKIEFEDGARRITGRVMSRDSKRLTDQDRGRSVVGKQVPVRVDEGGEVVWVDYELLRWDPLDAYLEALKAVRGQAFVLIAQLADVEFPSSVRADVEKEDALEDIYKIGKILRDLERGAKSWGATERGQR